ncbi:MAG: VWA domain-containing protein [Chloroflexi bacterium]|nr:VWA domain-containing protein [Chloroflexota bacterium]MDA1147092.1 VWA domain-containing protein [Chloroflexota bacterium]
MNPRVGAIALVSILFALSVSACSGGDDGTATATAGVESSATATATAEATASATATAAATASASATPRATTVVPQPVVTDNIALILDASGSMLNVLDGRTRLAIAQDAVAGLSTAFPGEAHASLWVYGHRLDDSDQEASCKDIEEVILLGPVEPTQFDEMAHGLDAKGWTPIGDSMIAAAESLPSDGEQRNTIVVVSDGLETCGADVCEVAAALVAANATLTIHTIGFDVDANVRAELECIAAAAGGQYFEADSASELIDALVQAASPGLSGDAFNAIEAEILTPDLSGANEVYTIEIRARHPEGLALTLDWNPFLGTVDPEIEEIGEAPDWVTSSVEWDLSAFPIGSYTMTVRVGDGTGWIGKSVNVEVTTSTVAVEAPNEAPAVLELTNGLKGRAGIFTYTVTVQDSDGDPVTVEWSPFVGTVAPPTVRLTGTKDPQTAEVQWDLSGLAPGQYSMNIGISDGEARFGKQVTVTITP